MFIKKKYNYVITFSFFYFIISAFFILLDSRNTFYLAFIFCFINDTLAYIFGNQFKGPKIIPKISPNKTWSGTLLSLFISSYLIFTYLDYNIFNSLLISSLFFFGDIFFSFFKRIRNVKDYSNLIPGHGGVLDRLDSLILPIIFIFIFVI
jgi:phosphatidate cytidylyltransferase